MNIISKIYNDKEFMSSASSIIFHDEFNKTKHIVHHGTTRYNHSIRVAYLSYKLSKLLGCDVNSSIRAGMLHDFFLLRDDTNIKTETKMLIKHPTIAKENAINYFGIDEKEQNIIESHMFPLSTVMPKSKEAWIVTFSDKLVAAFEGGMQAKARLGMWLLLFINFIK